MIFIIDEWYISYHIAYNCKSKYKLQFTIILTSVMIAITLRTGGIYYDKSNLKKQNK